MYGCGCVCVLCLCVYMCVIFCFSLAPLFMLDVLVSLIIWALFFSPFIEIEWKLKRDEGVLLIWISLLFANFFGFFILTRFEFALFAFSYISH